nr:PREDICTED: membrane progestin receptor gamma [Struthio camelus australis]
MLSLKLPRLLSSKQVPEGYQEQGILSGYRHPRSSATDCLLSVFQMTNETLNIWTHFVPAWYLTCSAFLIRTVDLYLGVRSAVGQSSWTVHKPVPAGSPGVPVSSVTSVGIGGFILACPRLLVVPGFILSETMKSIDASVRLLRIRIAFVTNRGLSLLPGSALAYSAYIFPKEWVNSTFHYYYVPIAVFNTVVSTSLSCYSRWRWHALTYLFDSIPLFYRFYLCAVESCTEAVITVHYRHTVLAFLTCFIFASHLPERLAPGHFDYIGHSHQVFHVCGIIGTHFQMEAIRMDMTERHDWLLATSMLPSALQTLGSMGLCIAISLTVIGLCSMSLSFMPEPLQREKLHGR